MGALKQLEGGPPLLFYFSLVLLAFPMALPGPPGTPSSEVVFGSPKKAGALEAQGGAREARRPREDPDQARQAQ